VAARGAPDPLDAALAKIEHQYGKGTAFVAGNAPRIPVQVIDTGSIGLNRALGVGGIARGRILEFYGPESSGKTSIALHAAANVQRAGGRVAVIDAEHALDPAWCATLGVDYDALVLSQPDWGEQGLDVADVLVHEAGACDLVIVDSVAALVPKAELDGDMGDTHVGLQARLMSQALRKLTGGASNTKTTIIFINQLREKVGVMFGSPETTSGGKALKFYASVRLDIRRIETLKDGTESIGNRLRIKVVKNKLGPPHRQVELDFLYSRGLARDWEVVDRGVETKVVRKAGAWYTYQGTQLGQGKPKAGEYLRAHPDLMREIEEKILAEDAAEPLPEPAEDTAAEPAEDPFGPPAGPRA
jgi:recombination protein RecA